MRHRVALGSLIVLGVSGSVTAEPMAGPRSLAPDPIAVRGGVLMVPLTADHQGDGWPGEMVLTLDDGREIRGVVVWLEPKLPAVRRRWTDDPRGLAVRAITPTDDSSQASRGAPYLLATLPTDGDGPVRIAQQVMQPRWHDLPAAEEAAGVALPLVARVDRPDPGSPFEYWRWVLLAERLDARPPPTDAYGELGSMVAQHYADLWRVGLGRLTGMMAEVGDRCRNLLTAVCVDGSKPVACWVSDPTRVGGLLGTLLDFDLKVGEVWEGARSWVDRQDLLVIRLGPTSSQVVAVIAANPKRHPVTARFRWLGTDAVVATVTVEPGVLQRVAIPRPPELARAGSARPDAADVRVVVMEAQGRQRQLVFPTGALVARPPGVALSPLRPPLTLAEAESGWQRRLLRTDRSTLVQVRRIAQRWEVFFDCRRPAVSVGNLSAAATVADVLGVEAVILLLGPEPARIVLAIGETGQHRVLRGAEHAGVKVHTRSVDDRWFCRVVLPAAWLGGREGEPLLLALLRTHGDSKAFETGPYAVVPWRPEPGRAVIDLTQWD